MRLTLAAVGAVIAAVLQLTIDPYLRIGDAQPELVLVFAVVATTAGSVEAGLISAFIGGLMIDALAPRPLGLTAFVLVLSVGVTAVLGRVLDRVPYLVPIVATFVTSLLGSALYIVLYGALRQPVTVIDPIQAVLPTAVYSTAVAAVIGPLAIAVRQRSEGRERVAW